MLAAPETAHVKMNTGPAGVEVLEVNGQDLKGAANAVYVEVTGSGPPVVTVVLESDVSIDGPGVVKIDSGGDARAEMVKFIQSLDPQVLERLSLDRLGWGNDSPTEALLSVLVELLGGSSADNL